MFLYCIRMLVDLLGKKDNVTLPNILNNEEDNNGAMVKKGKTTQMIHHQ